MEALETLGWILVGFVVTMILELIALWYFVLKD
jgi:hypothetical protein